MRILNSKRIYETIALALCIAMLVVGWAQVIAQENLVQQDDLVENDIIILAEETMEVSEDTKMEEAISEQEMELLARAVYSEARGEPFQGQIAIAAVILNRVEHEEFPDSINDVIFEPWAFTAVHDGQFWLTPDDTAYEAVEEALDGHDPSGGAIFYYNPVTATNQWIRSRHIITTIGKHVFAV